MLNCLKLSILGVVLLASLADAQVSDKPKTVAERLGYPADSRLLIIHAQDMGMAHSIDQATFEALEKGWVTSGSALVPCPWFPEVARWARNHPNVDLGVRIDVNASYPNFRWGSVSQQKSGSGLVDADGYLPATQAYVARHASPEDVAVEAKAQIDKAIKSGIHVGHLDNYAKALIQTPALFQVYYDLGKQYQVPIVFPSRQVVQRGVRQGGTTLYKMGSQTVDLRDFPMDGVYEIFAGYTKKDWLNVYEAALSAVPPGVYQLSVHLGFDTEELRAVTGNEPKWGSEWRQNDYDVIRSPEFQNFLKDKGFILLSYRDLQKAMQTQ